MSATLPVHFTLGCTEGLDSLVKQFKQETTLKDAISAIKYHLLEKNEHDLVECKNAQDLFFPRNLRIGIGTQNVINFEKYTFTMDSKTRFIDFWNDFLRAAKEKARQFNDDEFKSAKKDDADNIKYKGDMDVEYNDRCIAIDNDLMVSFQSTVRLPNDGQKYSRPIAVESMKLYQVSKCSNQEGMPKDWIAKKGFILPMWQREV